MSKKLIIGNWKLNPTTLKDAKKLAASISTKAKNKVVLCPPNIYLSNISYPNISYPNISYPNISYPNISYPNISYPNISYPNIGSQDCFWQEKGAFTGQTSPLMLKDLGVKYCIVGHSERRLIGETDGQINFKLRTLLEHKIIPVLCVGYGTTVEQDDLEVVDVLRNQLDADLKDVDASKVIVAYEPVWSIGTGKAASSEHAEQISIFIKTKYGIDKVLYGGSVTVNNASDFLHQQNIDGLLIGGASLIAKDFNYIINL